MTAKSFPEFLQKFTTVQAEEFVAMFTEDAVYVDGFFGALHGHEGIRTLLSHVADGGRDYSWTMHEPVFADDRGYARYVLRYTSATAGHEGHSVVFEGMSQFTFRGDKICRYYELFDRGVALAQMEFAPERIAKSLRRWAQETCAAADSLSN